MQKKAPSPDLQSFIPTLKDEEQRLQELLADARLRAEEIRRDAEEQAASLIHAARNALPAFLDAERHARRAALVQKAEEAGRRESEKIRAVELSARAAMEKTVAWIVSLVWPGGRKTAP
jgi:hypothetical protein